MNFNEHEFRAAYAAGAIREVVAVGSADGFNLRIVPRRGEAGMLMSRRQMMRRFATLQTLAAYLHASGIHLWRVDAAKWQPRQRRRAATKPE